MVSDSVEITLNPNFFSENSPFLNHPLLTAERAAAEIDFVLNQAQDAPFLDVGCGFGRHSLELARRGFPVVGLDPAEAMIAAANTYKQQLPPNQQSKATFVVSTGEAFDADHKFGTALCLMTTYGQVSASGPNNGLLKAIQQNLKPAGTLILEVPQKQAVIKTLKPDDHFGSDTHYTAITRNYDADSGCIVETFELVSPNSNQQFLLSYKLFDQPTIKADLHSAGFKVKAIFGGLNEEQLTTDSMNMVFVAEANG